MKQVQKFSKDKNVLAFTTLVHDMGAHNGLSFSKTGYKKACARCRLLRQLKKQGGTPGIETAIRAS